MFGAFSFGTWLLAWRYITHTPLRTALLVAALTITLAVPLVVRRTLLQLESQVTERARATPLVIGAKGSRFSLAIHALYFQGEVPPSIPQAELRRVEETGLAEAIPLLIKFRASDVSIVATTNAYLDLRKLTLDEGQPMERLGDCLLGANVAKLLGLAPGDRLLSDPENAFDLSGPTPLRMRVTGVISPTGTADDDVVFCSLQTAWIIEGLGHGHFIQPSPEGSAASTGEQATGDEATHAHEAGRENLSQYAEVTEENIKSFHFHGRRDDYPLTAIIALPKSEKGATLLRGKYLEPEERCQIISLTETIEELLQLVGRFRRWLDIAAALAAVTAAVLTSLVVLLSLRLRQREMQTLVRLGCSRGMIVSMITAELLLVLAASGSLAICLASLVSLSAGWMLRWFV